MMHNRTTQALAFGAFFLLLGLFTSSGEVSSSVILQRPTPTPSSAMGPCGEMGEIVTQPIVDPAIFCPEYLLKELPRTALASITSIAYAPTCEMFEESPDWCGALFFVRPDTGALMWVGEHDAVSNTYALHTFASDLQVPNGLAWHDGSWYVSGDQHLYRITDNDGDGSAESVQILRDDLPAGQGEWTGSIAIGPDERLYVSKGASCDNCEELDLRRATIMSAALDGTDLQIPAYGLHYAFDFDWHPTSGELWAVESAGGSSGSKSPLDELNRVTASRRNFGWPDCDHDNRVMSEYAAPSACEDAIAPELLFEAHSRPSGMTFYAGAAFPDLQGDLLVVASGTSTQRLPSGFALYRICFDDLGEPEHCSHQVGQPLPSENPLHGYAELLLPVDSHWGYDLDVMHIQGQSFYPDHPVDVAISPEGYITISVMEGRLIQVRPSPASTPSDAN